MLEKIVEESIQELKEEEQKEQKEQKEEIKEIIIEPDFDLDLGFDLSEVDIKSILFYILLILICIAVILFYNNVYLKKILRLQVFEIFPTEKIPQYSGHIFSNKLSNNFI